MSAIDWVLYPARSGRLAQVTMADILNLAFGAFIMALYVNIQTGDILW